MDDRLKSVRYDTIAVLGGSHLIHEPPLIHNKRGTHTQGICFGIYFAFVIGLKVFNFNINNYPFEFQDLKQRGNDAFSQF